MQSYIFLGPPASGKGTQAKDLANNLGLVYFGTGDLMRAEVKSQSHFGEIFQEVFGRGEGSLVSDEVVLEFVKLKIHDLDISEGIVFDGFPRTIKQAEFLNQTLNNQLTVFNIEVSQESIISRSSTRRVCESCGKIFFKAPIDKKSCEICGGDLIQRQEDTPEIVLKRLEVYYRETAPLIDYYKQKNMLVEIDGEPNIDEVARQIETKVHERSNHN